MKLQNLTMCCANVVASFFFSCGVSWQRKWFWNSVLETVCVQFSQGVNILFFTISILFSYGFLTSASFNLWSNRSSLKIFCTWVSDSLTFLIPIVRLLPPGLYFLIKDFTIDFGQTMKEYQNFPRLGCSPRLFLFGVSILRCPPFFLCVYP